jgi:predicted phosphate transport protein (TIGR00153 family)
MAPDSGLEAFVTKLSYEIPRMLGWFHRLMPKEERFFDLFARHSETVVDGARALRAMLDGGDALQRHYQAVMDRENDADAATREVLMAIRRSFITPFDRGDIKDLITSMDNAIDQMQKTAKTIMLFDVRTFTPEMKGMGDAIVAAAGLVHEAIPLMRSMNAHAGRISSITEQISQLEGRADDMHDNGLRALYQQNWSANDALAFFVGSEVYDHLEKVVDRFDDVANEIHGIVLEHV